MRAVIQRVKKASVRVGGKITGAIEQGLCVFLGVSPTDTEKDVRWMAEKIAFLRIFEDENAKMNLSVQDVKGSVLAVSQFTLYGDCSKGRRPSFVQAGAPSKAKKLYEDFTKAFEPWNIPVQTGIFQADLQVELINDGPATFIVDSPSSAVPTPPVRTEKAQNKFDKEAALLRRNLQLRKQQQEAKNG